MCSASARPVDKLSLARGGGGGHVREGRNDIV